MFLLYPNLRLIALIEDYVELDFPLSLLMNQTACHPGILVILLLDQGMQHNPEARQAAARQFRLHELDLPLNPGSFFR
jgi:hypothetical protein